MVETEEQVEEEKATLLQRFSRSLGRSGSASIPRLLALSVVLGVVGALASAAFSWMVMFVERTALERVTGYHPPTAQDLASHDWHDAFHMHPLIPLVTGLGGLLTGIIVAGLAPEAEGHGTDAAVEAYHRKAGRIRARVPWVKAVASAITIGTGGAAGREGPTAQIAAGVGSMLANIFKLSDQERRAAVLIGMAAGLSAMFRSPLGTAIFAVEVVYSSMTFESGILVYTLISSSVAYGVVQLMGDSGPILSLPRGAQDQSPVQLLGFVLLGLVCGIGSAFLPTIFYWTRDRFQALPLPQWARPAVGGLLVGCIGLFAAPVLGSGYGVVQYVLDGAQGFPLLLLLGLAAGKAVALSLTVGSGGSGGVFAPSLFVGALAGAGTAGLLHMADVPAEVPAMTVVGMAALFAGAARVPIATMVMVTEMTGGYSLMVPAMIGVAMSFLLQEAITHGFRYPSLYEAQVRSAADSPVHREEYYRVTADLLRKSALQIEELILRDEVLNALRAGRVLPLGGDEAIAAVRVKRLGWEGKCVSDVDREHVIFAGVQRGGHEIVPRGDTVLEDEDVLVVVGERHAVAGLVREARGSDHEASYEEAG